MRQFTTFLTAIVLIAGAVTVHSWAQESLGGEWRAKFDRGAREAGTMYLELRTSSGKHTRNWGNTQKAGDFAGLDAGLASKDGTARFELRREAGTLAFAGSFRGGEGKGDFQFTPNAEFVQSMKGLGYSGLST